MKDQFCFGVSTILNNLELLLTAVPLAILMKGEVYLITLHIQDNGIQIKVPHLNQTSVSCICFIFMKSSNNHSINSTPYSKY